MKIIENFKDITNNWSKTGRHNGEIYRTKSGLLWYNMDTRTKVNGDCQIRHQTYIGCTMSDNFKDFQFFVEWHIAQIGYNIDNYHLDKDLLVKDNKIYSENTCVLIPSELNKFFCAAGAIRGLYPQGVCFSKQSGKFIAYIRINGNKCYLGSFNTVEQAYATYKFAKEAEARRWYERLKAGEFIVDPRVIERMRTWTLESSNGT